MSVHQPILDELEASLTEQLKLVRGGELQRVDDLAGRTQELIGQLSSMNPAILIDQHSQSIASVTCIAN